MKIEHNSIYYMSKQQAPLVMFYNHKEQQPPEPIIPLRQADPLMHGPPIPKEFLTPKQVAPVVPVYTPVTAAPVYTPVVASVNNNTCKRACSDKFFETAYQPLPKWRRATPKDMEKLHTEYDKMQKCKNNCNK